MPGPCLDSLRIITHHFSYLSTMKTKTKSTKLVETCIQTDHWPSHNMTKWVDPLVHTPNLPATWTPSAGGKKISNIQGMLWTMCWLWWYCQFWWSFKLMSPSCWYHHRSNNDNHIWYQQIIINFLTDLMSTILPQSRFRSSCLRPRCSAKSITKGAPMLPGSTRRGHHGITTKRICVLGGTVISHLGSDNVWITGG